MVKQRKAKKASEPKKAAALPKEDENEEIDVGGGEIDVDLNATGRGKAFFSFVIVLRTFHHLSKSM